jgi:hypothetical protein
MTRTRFEQELDSIRSEIGNDIILDSVRDAIWERVLGKSPSERRGCTYCKKTFFPHRKDQHFCPGGKCSNAYHSAQYRERNG